jgi:2'-deoxynucleoside 5'-phosphate N-hydrolase
MRAYIAISYAGRTRLQDELETICATLRKSGIDPFVFVDQYTFNAEDETAMMQKAMEEIDRSDLLIAATSEKAIGIGIEAGYAKAKGKPVIYIRHINAEHSTTLSGISDHQILYFDLQELVQKLKSIVEH